MSQMRTDILGHPPSLCNCRRVWHPCHTHAPYQGVQLSQLHQPSSHCIFPQNSQNFLAEENFCVFCVFRGTILRNLNICVHLCHPWENTITAGGVGMAGMPYPPKCVLWAVHLCLVGAAETAAPPERTSVSICEICGRTPRTLTFYVFRGRTHTVCLSTRSSST